MEFAPIVIASLALALSGVTAWLTLLRKGTLKMTKPTVIYFGPDGGARASPKIYLRALLYSTSKKTQIIESMFVRVERSDTVQNFNIWVHGNQALRRGSGVYVPEHGYASDHHFLLPDDAADFLWKAGEHKIQLLARLVGSTEPVPLFETSLTLRPEDQEALGDPDVGIYFDWVANTGDYQAHPRKRDLPDALAKLLKAAT